MKLFHFLGSVYFAIVLIALSILFILAGTLLESWSDSHAFAAAFTYSNPLFQLLLWLYFVNILFAALRRLPFKASHIPFLLTHAGLLMILAGCLAKGYLGLQGSMGLTEGCSSSELFIRSQYAVTVETPDASFVVPLRKEMTLEDLSLSVEEWVDHTEMHYEGFIKGEALAPLPYAATLGKPQAENPQKNTLYFFKDPEGIESLIAFDREGNRYENKISTSAIYVYNKGYSGYGVFTSLPPQFSLRELVAPLTRRFSFPKPPLKIEEQRPLIRLAISRGDECEQIVLPFDPFATELKWPALKGKYLLRFSWLTQKIPFSVRLKEAREIYYPGSDKPYAYEAKIEVAGEEKRLSMNRVYEKKGYRFYLANMIVSPDKATQIQLVVNYDKTKYYLTYPGAIILAVGMLLLYLRRRYV